MNAWSPIDGITCYLEGENGKVFSTLFGADDSLKQFWKNLATAKVIQHV